MQARCRRVFGNAHTYHINAISISSDQETFISSDDLRVNLWHLDHTQQSFNVVDIKPPNMEDLTEVSLAAGTVSINVSSEHSAHLYPAFKCSNMHWALTTCSMHTFVA